jgi:hypothetical protein
VVRCGGAGIDGSFEGENGDYRAFTGIGLPGAQAELVASVAAHYFMIRAEAVTEIPLRFC